MDRIGKGINEKDNCVECIWPRSGRHHAPIGLQSGRHTHRRAGRPPPPPPPRQSSASGLKISGKVGAQQTLKDADLKAMPTLSVNFTDKKGAKATYTGVPLKSLLDLVKPAADAATLTFVAGDGFSADMALKDALACDKCVVAFTDPNGYTTIFPDFPFKLNVRGLAEIQVK